MPQFHHLYSLASSLSTRTWGLVD